MTSAKAESRGSGPEAVPAEAAEFAVAYLRELSPDLRGCALLDADGKLLAASGDDGWHDAAGALLAAADAAGGERADQVHVGTEEGEAFAVRHDGLAMVAVTDRFTLASLVLFDIRTILRDLALGGEVVDRRAIERPARAEPAEGEEADPALGGWPAAEEL
jgi:hypothetical protein